ncbi:MAG TPA: hypothetical protein VFK40_06335 [Nitrososphaeraceae archaeon]|nr:hypothetical protein [Nitrososphaeraceae archaeon]
MFSVSSGLIITVELFVTSEAILLIFCAVVFIKSVMVFVVVVDSWPKTREIVNSEKQISLQLLIHTRISYFSTIF